MSCKRLDSMEFHCYRGRQLVKYTLVDCTIDLVTFPATLPFMAFLCVIPSVLQSWFYRCPLKLQYFIEEKIIFHKSLHAVQFD